MSAPTAILALLGDTPELFSASRENNLMTVLLILALSIALVLGLVCLLVAIHVLRSVRLARQRDLQRLRPAARLSNFRPPTSSAPSRWLAVRSDNPQAVQSALGLLKPHACSWEEGLAVACDQKLFISPVVDGWVFVIGASLPEPAQDVDRCFHFIRALSRKLGAVQFFSAHRSLSRHAWVQAEHGEILRAYAWAGQTLWNQGAMTKAEVDLRLKCFAYGVTAERGESSAFNTERVALLAARWSVDPSSIGARMPRETRGIAGELSPSGNR